jgi:signal transduction histidine kinase
LAERSRAQERAARFTTSTALVCGALAFVAAAFGVLSVVRRRDDRRLEEQNLRLEREVEERTAALEETNAELEAFAATISHDLRAPVRAIGGYAAAIEEDAGDRLVGDERDYLARIAEAAERMDALIEDILGYSRLGRQQLSLAPVSLESAVNLELAERRKDAARTGAEVEVIRPLPAVRAHGGALGLAVGNLLDNALKFVRRGERAQVRIWAERRDSGAIRLWVEDRGIGVAPSNQERIFRPFERLHGREAYAGSGVGLAIVRRVAERMGGSCGVLSSPGVGSRFWIELPAADKVSGPAPGRSRP